MEIRLNGEPHALEGSLTIAQLLDSLGVGKRRVAVELNRDIIPRESYSATAVAAGDVIEIVHFVGGG